MVNRKDEQILSEIRQNSTRRFGSSPCLRFPGQSNNLTVNHMKLFISALVSAFVLATAPAAFAAAHAGGKMDDKVDCSKKENADKEACKKK